ncbi:hypothetical protein QA649_24620 [Bradyrhizobium sp. CB1717]|uniref:hypothetical protein n=1 Tax=Bradyrhizobium sp. CB1717 TaxID=3039154 RepID=UPI0024B08E47|nr:hypothetical protein [Bradyrhizobium sp. CB1717]WFU21293.1 hypothetical protein QA649_24620 [Bradyrhizobium sp. CB1717]
MEYQYRTRDVLRFEYRVLLVILLLSAFVCLAIGFGLALPDIRGKWVNSAGLLFDVSGVVQLHISGLFDEILSRYGDDEKYPFGPPSHITRRIIDNPDTPIRMWIRTQLFFEGRTGFYLLLAGFLFQLIGTWV